MAAGLKSSEPLNARDIGRGMAIVAVMYGHALAPWFMGAGRDFSEQAFLQWKFGAAFMMSFFFFLSGVGWRSNRSLAAAIQQGLSLILIAWLSSVLFDLLRVALTFAGLSHTLGVAPLGIGGFVRSEAASALLADNYALGPTWFLGALGIVRIIAALAVRGGAGGATVITVVVAALTVAADQYGWHNVAQIQLLGPAFAFFMAGYALRRVWARAERAPRACAATMLVALALTVATFGLNHGCRWDPTVYCGVAWLNNNFGVAMINGMFGNWLMFSITAIVGTVFASCVAILLARFGSFVGVELASWGRASMDLLIVNAFFLMLLNPSLSTVLVPYLPAQGALFFLALATVTIVVNLLARLLVTRQLKQLRALARKLSTAIVDAVVAASENAAVMRRGYRVSRGHD
ncbi:MAG TPA: acyltransferase family protein [Vitreimonas sp.]|nr:acyltransferase family protein [Vitreimonas sp.]